VWLAQPVIAADLNVDGNITSTGTITTDPAATNLPGALTLGEASANGTNFKQLISPSAITATTICTLENDANFIPDSCVGNGVDDTGDIEAAEAGAHLSAAAGVISVDAELDNQIENFAIVNPTTALTGYAQAEWPTAVTILGWGCSTDTGTATINFQSRVRTTPNTAGDNIGDAAVVCDTNSEGSGALSNAGISTSEVVAITITATSGTPNVLRAFLGYTIDD
jgi:hypothetical protein